MKLTIWIDCDTLMQVGSDLRDADGEFIAEYYFRDIELNPKFDDKQFTRAAQ
jgi:outer membrane lipoprotein-sorting protein